MSSTPAGLNRPRSFRTRIVALKTNDRRQLAPLNRPATSRAGLLANRARNQMKRSAGLQFEWGGAPTQRSRGKTRDGGGKRSRTSEHTPQESCGPTRALGAAPSTTPIRAAFALVHQKDQLTVQDNLRHTRECPRPSQEEQTRLVPTSSGITTNSRASLDKCSAEDIRARTTRAFRIAGANILRKKGEGLFKGTGNAIPCASREDFSFGIGDALAAVQSPHANTEIPRNRATTTTIR
ncbi:hypothetical protein MRX96_019373 [Rhipicephalus microplus]